MFMVIHLRFISFRCVMCNTPHNTSWMNVYAGTEAVRVEQDDTRGPQGTCYYR